MLELSAELNRWSQEGRAFAVATVVAVRGSAPRPPGAALAVDAEGTVLGSVSGGCVEAEVYALCEQATASGETRTVVFGYDPDDPFATGLSCGGELEVLVTPVPARRSGPAHPPVVRSPRPALPNGRSTALPPDPATAVSRALSDGDEGRPTALVRVVSGPPQLRGAALSVTGDGHPYGTLGGSPELDRAARAAAKARLLTGGCATVRLGTAGAGTEGGPCGEPVTLFVETRLPPPRMLVFGAVDFAAAVARAGAFLGYRVTVCDAREVFATPQRFPEADEVVVDWPHRYLDREHAAGRLDERTAVCVLTHDEKFDVPLLLRALRLRVEYVGAMGSRRTHRSRLERLRLAGVSETEMSRLRSPIGLDLGARSPEETALSIVGEIVALRHGGSGVPLSDTDEPLHRDERAEGVTSRRAPTAA
ncbi:XdhC family protein [Streptomyces sp. NPDC005438]|uniref:XdhC family protein n=1 Tax=Streptomyces sp. NPDC005438 TaxID=3156880 RepID=UPI0033AA11AA